MLKYEYKKLNNFKKIRKNLKLVYFLLLKIFKKVLKKIKTIDFGRKPRKLRGKNNETKTFKKKVNAV